MKRMLIKDAKGKLKVGMRVKFNHLPDDGKPYVGTVTKVHNDRFHGDYDEGIGCPCKGMYTLYNSSHGWIEILDEPDEQLWICVYKGQTRGCGGCYCSNPHEKSRLDDGHASGLTCCDGNKCYHDSSLITHCIPYSPNELKVGDKLEPKDWHKLKKGMKCRLAPNKDNDDFFHGDLTVDCYQADEQEVHFIGGFVSSENYDGCIEILAMPEGEKASTTNIGCIKPRTIISTPYSSNDWLYEHYRDSIIYGHSYAQYVNGEWPKTESEGSMRKIVMDLYPKNTKDACLVDQYYSEMGLTGTFRDRLYLEQNAPKFLFEAKALEKNRLQAEEDKKD